MSVLVAGSANLDFVVRADRIPAPGQTVLGREFTTFPGGKGANQAIASARAGGVETRMLLALGRDAYAAPLEVSLHEAGVQLHVVRCEDVPTGTAFICLADDGENAITVAPGANSVLHAAHLPSLGGVSHLLLQLETPIDAVTAYAIAARARQVAVVLNAAPARALPSELLAALDILVVNEGELAAITGIEGDLDCALMALAVPTVIVTLGAEGCRARHEGRALQVAGFKVDVVDTTAAGDTFCGALVAALSQGRSMPNALREASAAAALACTQLGAQASIPSRADVLAFLQQQAST